MPEAQDFDMFYAATSRRLVGQLFAMTGDLSEAEDAVQEAYIKAWRQWPQVRSYENPEAWLRLVAHRISVNAWRKARNRLFAHYRADQGRADQGRDDPGLSPDQLALVDALRQISAEQRRAIVLHYLADLSVEEIAAETGAPPGTVKARLARGRRALAPLVCEWSDEPPPTRRHHSVTHPARASRKATSHA
ncbi:MAG: RNA polymerase sigma factor [Trebonia sp.]